MGTPNNDTKPSVTIENNILIGEKSNSNITKYGIGESILKILNEDPHNIAQIDANSGEQTTFKEMKICIIRCALWMQKQGIGTGDVVLVCCENRLESYIPVYATFLIGAVFNPWHHEVTSATAKHLMNLTRPKIIFSCERAANILKEVARQENVDAQMVIFGNNNLSIESLSDIMEMCTKQEVQEFRPKEIKNPNDLALIIFSSGTTGLPKGVAHSYRTLSNIVQAFIFMPKKNTISLCYSSFYWISGTMYVLQTIYTKTTKILHDNFDPDETCKVIEKFKINWVFFSPTQMIQLYKSNVLKKYNLSSLKTLLTGGSKLNSKILQEIKLMLPETSILQGYGMTELGGVAAIQTNQCKIIDSVGFVPPNAQCKVVDIISGETLGPDQPGELCFKISTSMVGYYRNPIATNEVIDKEGWIHTGDKGYFTENGEIIIVERIKELMKYRSFQILPFEIESVLLSDPRVLEVAVVPIPHLEDGEHPMAFVKRKPGVEVTEQELVQLSSTLGEYKKLHGGVKFLSQMPYTATGKINRKELKEIAKSYEC